MTVVAVVPASGRGDRLGAGAPKALVPVGGVAMVARAVAGLRASGVVDAVVVTAPPGGSATMRAVLVEVEPGRGERSDGEWSGRGERSDGEWSVVVVDGGADRVASVRAGLSRVPADADVVLVHDAARCLCPPEVTRAVVDAVREGHGAVVPACTVADTLKRVDDAARVRATVDRAGLVGVQTPQGFAAPLLRAVHDRAAAAEAAGDPLPVTDDAGLVEHTGATVTVVPGDPRAFKITTPLDLAMAEALVAVGTA